MALLREPRMPLKSGSISGGPGLCNKPVGICARVELRLSGARDIGTRREPQRRGIPGKIGDHRREAEAVALARPLPDTLKEMASSGDTRELHLSKPIRIQAARVKLRNYPALSAATAPELLPIIAIDGPTKRCK